MLKILETHPCHYIFVLHLLIPLALLAASCGGNSDITTSEDSALEDSASQDRRDSLDDSGDSQSDSQNSRGSVSRESGYSQNEDPNRAIAITAGDDHTCALRQTGTITCWGSDGSQQLGNSTQNDSSVPVKVLGINDATAITAGASFIGGHTCALRQTGTITCWGHNWHGQLGNGAQKLSSMPVEVLGINDSTAITAGGWHTCALRQADTITCWGHNEHGQLGNGNRGHEARSSVPVKVLGITDATAITAGTVHTCALRQTGTIACWGNNDDGQLGNGQSRDISSVPVAVLDITDATAITAGIGHTCALRQTGTITCWGFNYNGQLGNGQSGRAADSSVPIEVLGITDATAITAGGSHTCALRRTGTITCWGNNHSGQLGNGQSGYNSSVPVEVLSHN